MRKGEPAWNKGMKGYVNSGSFKKGQKSSYGNLGKKRSAEAIEKQKISNAGFKHSEETKIKQSISKLGAKNPQYGKIRSKEHCEKISKGVKTNAPWLGKQLPSYVKDKISASRKDKSYEEIYGIEQANRLKKFHSDRNKLNGNPAWKGGKSFEPYTLAFNDDFKQNIRLRDHFSCVKCNIFEEDAKKLYNQRLCIHHIDYNKLNTNEENCCSLCLRCHMETNLNREQWPLFFHSLLNKKYGYDYSSNDIIFTILSQGV